MAIAQVVGALAYSPGHATLGTVRNVPPDSALVRLPQHGERKRTHNEHGHQVLEHAAAPRDERRLAGGPRQRPPEVKPVFDRNVILRDGDEAGKPRFRGEEIVVGRVERVATLLIANGEQLPVAVEQKAKVHLHREVVCALGDGLEPRADLVLAGHVQTCAPHGNEVTAKIAAVDGGDVGRFEHAQIVQIVPVVEMAPKAAHALEGAQGQLEAPRHVLGGDEAEIARAHGRQQLKPDVRWRHPHRCFRPRILLKIVRREPVRTRVDERVEVPPVELRVPHRETPLLRRELRSPGRSGLAELVRDRRREAPQRDEWQHDRADEPASGVIRMRELA